MIGPVQFPELVGLWGRDAAERLAGDVLRGRDFVVDHEDLLVVGHRGDSVPVLVALDDDVGQHTGLDERPDAVVDDDDVVVRALSFQVENAVPDGLLPAFAAGHDPLELIDAELPGIGPQHLVPAVDADDLDGVDAGMFLEAFERIDEDGLVVDIQELFRDVLAHPGAGSAGDDDGNGHNLYEMQLLIVFWKREREKTYPFDAI